MKYYNRINENGLFSGITSRKREGFNYTEIPLKPLIDDETAKFNFETNEWEYSFKKEKEMADTPYSVVWYMPSTLYTSSIYPQCGDLVLEKSTDISILIPCYGKSEYLEDAVKSCINQTMKPTNIIVLLMDEESIAMKEQLETLDSIITCIVSERLNACASRTKLVNEYCPTDWFILLDADDMLKENFVEEVYKENSSVSFGLRQVVEENGNIGEHDDVFVEGINIFWGHSFECITSNLTSLMNKQIFNEIGLDEELCDGGEDFDFTIRLYEQQKYKISLSNKTCYYYRQTNGLTNKHEFYDSHFRAVKKNMDFLHKEYIATNGHDEFEEEFYNNPTLDTFAQSIKCYMIDLLNSKEGVILTKLNNSKLKTPMSAYSNEQFTVIGDREISDLNYINKTFDVLFLEELNRYNIFNDSIDMIINKDILPEIEDKIGYERLLYLLDNYSCFIEKNPNKVLTDEELEIAIRKSSENNDMLKEQIRLLDIERKQFIMDRKISINFVLHKDCNLNCPYCTQGLNKCNLCNDDEIYNRFDEALTYLEENMVNVKLEIRLLGGEPTLWSDYLIEKVMDRLKDYRRVGLFTNGTNTDSLWYKYDKVFMLVHVTDWKEHPEKLKATNLKRNQIPTIVVCHDEIDEAIDVIKSKLHSCLSVAYCYNSPDSNLNLTAEDVNRLKEAMEGSGITITDDCKYSSMEFDCETMQGKICCKSAYKQPIEEMVESINNNNCDIENICKSCKLYEFKCGSYQQN